MLESISLVPILAPAALALAALISYLNPGLRPTWALRATRFASLLAGLVAIASAVILSKSATSLVSPLFGIGGIGFSFRLDPLSALMLFLVTSLGIFVIQFSRNYLDGDSRQGVFLGDLSLTLVGVTLLVLSGNLFHLVFAWIGTSLALHRLLLFYRHRTGAVLAARKKFMFARTGDVCLIVAAILLARHFHTTDIGSIISAAKIMDPANIPTGVLASSLFICLAAFLKSAQFPSHGWLPEVMETPTPVSALLHAGIINGGTFLVVRLSDIVFLSDPARMLLLVVGGFTALFASAIMITQSGIKTSLAFSSVAHMGFMLFQCGLGAFPLAIIHLVAHSYYKAHAFLASGSAVEAAKAVASAGKAPAPKAGDILVSFGIALAVYGTVSVLVGVPMGTIPSTLILGAIFVMGMTHLFVHGATGGVSFQNVVRTSLFAGATSLSFCLLEMAAEHVLAPTIPVVTAPSSAVMVLSFISVAAFAAVTVLQLMAPHKMGNRAWRTAYVHIKNGFYVNAWVNRFIGSNRVQMGLPVKDSV